MAQIEMGVKDPSSSHRPPGSHGVASSRWRVDDERRASRDCFQDVSTIPRGCKDRVALHPKETACSPTVPLWVTEAVYVEIKKGWCFDWHGDNIRMVMPLGGTSPAGCVGCKVGYPIHRMLNTRS